jgi:hypothetical protein
LSSEFDENEEVVEP